MRVSENMRYSSVTNNLSQLSARQAAAAEQAQTGLRINLPSDDPVAAARLARLAASQSQIAARRDSISTVRGDTELAEASLQQASELLASAKELAMQGGNGSLSAGDRANLALEVKSLREQLVGVANTRGSTGYLFGGSQTQSKPFAETGVFSGDDESHVVDIGNSTPTAVNASGAKAFTAAGGRDVFADLDSLFAALNANDTAAISATLDHLDSSRAQVTNAQAATGIILNRLDTSDSVLTMAELQTAKSTEEASAADPARAFSTLTQLNNSLQQSVTVAKMMLDLSAFKQF